MAISQESWGVAQAMFEGGASLQEISFKTDIDKSTISKKAKSLGWEKGINQHMIADEVRVSAEKSTLNQPQVEYHDEQVKAQLELLREIKMFSGAAMSKAHELLSSSTSGSDFKAIVEGVDKLSITTGVNERHAKPAQVQQNTQNNGTTELVITRAIREN